MSTNAQHRHQDGQVQHGAVRLELVVLFALCQPGRSDPTLKPTITCCDDQRLRHDDDNFSNPAAIDPLPATQHDIGTPRSGSTPNEAVAMPHRWHHRLLQHPSLGNPPIYFRDALYKCSHIRRALGLREERRRTITATNGMARKFINLVELGMD